MPVMSQIVDTDSYKTSHFLQYPPGTEIVNAYIEARTGARYPTSVFFGLQYLLKEYFSKPVTREEVEEGAELWPAHGVPFHAEGWRYIVDQHGGYLPLEIEAVPEGSVVENSNVLLQVRNTDPKLWWLPGYAETRLMRLWYPITVCTQSRAYKELIWRYLAATCENPAAEIPFKLHDFGSRGASSLESAALGGVAHLVNFMGTDTGVALRLARLVYGADMAGFSIPAAEHSTITAWGDAPEHEVDAFRNMIFQFGRPSKLVAVVSDSRDFHRAVDEHWGQTLKQDVLACGGTLVVRPDSGKPSEMVRYAVRSLANSYGATRNKLGFHVLHPSVRVIQGDGVNYESIGEILEGLKADGFSTENVAFGMGAELLQKVNRDTQRMAMKASAIRRDGAWVDVLKTPKTDAGKASKPGVLSLVAGGAGLKTVRRSALNGGKDLLEPVFRNGRILREQTLDDIRERAKLPA